MPLDPKNLSHASIDLLEYIMDNLLQALDDVEVTLACVASEDSLDRWSANLLGQEHAYRSAIRFIESLIEKNTILKEEQPNHEHEDERKDI